MNRSAHPHLHAQGHAAGTVRYAGDGPFPPGTLMGCVVPAGVAAGHLVGLEVDEARAVDGVVAVLTASDLPARVAIGAVIHDEPLLAAGPIGFVGQPVALVVARDRESAERGAAAVRVDVEAAVPVLDLDAAMAGGHWHTPPHVIARGDVEAALAAAALTLSGTLDTPAQDHFYLETQVAWAQLDGDGQVTVHASTQHPSEMAREVAAVLGLRVSEVTVIVPRLGGGFGGKESQATWVGCLAALAARATGHPVLLRLDRGQDMGWTGKRHPFRARWRAGFDSDGRLRALDVDLVSDGGWSLDLSGPVMDRALFHLDAGCAIDAVRFSGRVARTNLPSNTAFRGFGGPQGMLVTATVLHDAALRLGLPLETIWRRNVYGPETGVVTPYGQVVDRPRGGFMLDRLAEHAGLEAWRAEIAATNAASAWRKRGLGIALVQFGISFTNGMLNQAGALVHIWTDGSVVVQHGGTEMGQGIHTKMAAVAAEVLGVPHGAVRVLPTDTRVVPNTSATAASSGTDLNGAAVADACLALKARLARVAAAWLEVPEPALVWEGGRIHAGTGRSVSFAELAHRCWVERVSLSAAGSYRTPGIVYDRDAGRGTPFFYMATGVGAVEVEVCGLTGEFRLRRVHLVQDVGASWNPHVDRGQVEGAFVMGVGWLTTEECQVDGQGRVTTRGPSTYKIPSAGDVPEDFVVELVGDPQADVVGGSRAVGEPPLLLGSAVVPALREAVAAFGRDGGPLPLPCSPERLLRAITASQGGRFG